MRAWYHRDGCCGGHVQHGRATTPPAGMPEQTMLKRTESLNLNRELEGTTMTLRSGRTRWHST
jgi:hypothetical protein